MSGFPLLAASFFIKAVAVLFVICAVVLIFVVLLQKGKGGGLSAAFAGGMASGILGSKTGDFLTWVTIAMVSVFLVLAVVLTKFYKPSATAEFNTGRSAQQTQPVEQPGEKAPFAAPGADESGDTNLPGS